MEFRGKTIGVWWRLLSKAASVRVSPPESLLVREGLGVTCKSCSGLDKDGPVGSEDQEVLREVACQGNKRGLVSRITLTWVSWNVRLWRS